MEGFFSGFGLGGSLIIAIGAQNAFVLRQGLRRHYPLLVAALCVTCDWVLILLGVFGFGAFVARFPVLTSIAAWGGAIFLLAYGFSAFRSAARPKGMALDDERLVVSWQRVVLLTLAVSLLNPHVYLDTVVLIGGIAAQYQADSRPYFAAGAMLASALWFFALALGARFLTPLFRRPAAWRVLDGLIGVIMWLIAFSLIASELTLSQGVIDASRKPTDPIHHTQYERVARHEAPFPAPAAQPAPIAVYSLAARQRVRRGDICP